tara:strand:- start:140 stop:460 length:321 start_codon:yes stop_codon:yes gene_type:complete
MHYVIGTQIVVEKKSNRVVPGMSSQQLKENLKRSKHDGVQSQFEINRVYTLTRIYKKDENVIYCFTDGVERKEVQFDNTKTADQFIAELRQETLPDYISIYERMTH